MNRRAGRAALFAACFLAMLGRRAWSQAGPTPCAEGIEAVLVADTLKGPAGAEQSLRAMEHLITSIRRLGRDVRVSLLEGPGVTPAGVLGEVRRLDSSRLADRTFVFYYAGHGGTDPRTGHFLRTPAGDLARSTLAAEIRAKSPRLALILTDCCSTRASLHMLTPQPHPLPDRRAVDDLFFKHVGVVDMNSSSCDPERGIYQAAFYEPGSGGLFTSAFTSMFVPTEELVGLLPDYDRIAPRDLEQGHPRRFEVRTLSEHDRDRDGFLDWSEAREYLDAAVLASFQRFQDSARGQALRGVASAADLRLLREQISQDPQVFGPLASRSDRPEPAQVTPTGPALKAPRLGVQFVERYERGGAYLEVSTVDPRSPAARVTVWKRGRREGNPTSLVKSDTIVWANKVRIRSQADLLKVMDRVPPGGELNIAGYDGSTGRASRYEATVILDRFE